MDYYTLKPFDSESHKRYDARGKRFMCEFLGSMAYKNIVARFGDDQVKDEDHLEDVEIIADFGAKAVYETESDATGWYDVRATNSQTGRVEFFESGVRDDWGNKDHPKEVKWRACAHYNGLGLDYYPFTDATVWQRKWAKANCRLKPTWIFEWDRYGDRAYSIRYQDGERWMYQVEDVRNHRNDGRKHIPLSEYTWWKNTGAAYVNYIPTAIPISKIESFREDERRRRTAAYHRRVA